MRAGLSILGYGAATLLLRRRIPLVASFKLTYRCNLRCAVCPYHRRGGEARGGEARAGISWRRALAALAELERLGCRFVIFEGGEPLLWRDGARDFSSLAERARRMFLRVGVTTNGTLPLDVPVDLLWVSLDGARAQHDRRRDGSFERAVENIRLARRRAVFVHYTVNRENIDDIFRLALALRGEPHVRGITFQLVYTYRDSPVDLSLCPAERERAVRTVLELKRSGSPPVLNSCGTLRRMVRNDWRCRGWMFANVDPDGRVRTGCYLAGRGEIDCRRCGFTPVAEASRAFTLHPGALQAGWRIFLQPREG